MACNCEVAVLVGMLLKVRRLRHGPTKVEREKAGNGAKGEPEAPRELVGCAELQAGENDQRAQQAAEPLPREDERQLRSTLRDIRHGVPEVRHRGTERRKR